MRISRKKAMEQFEKIDDSCYPPLAYNGGRFKPMGAIRKTYTELETDLLQACEYALDVCETMCAAMCTLPNKS